jgi:hypothetical protein
MKARLLAVSQNLKEKLILTLLYLGGVLIMSALVFQLGMISLSALGKVETIREITHWMDVKFDGRFKNDVNSIWYNIDDQIWVESVTNEVKIGKLAGNRKLEFGVKNILEEFLQEKDYNLSPNSPNKLLVQIIYLDVLTTKKNVSVFHKNEEEVVIRLRGVLKSPGKKDKVVIVEESSSEISMSTLIVDEGGGFNQTSLSNALKKSCDKLITKLSEVK